MSDALTELRDSVDRLTGALVTATAARFNWTRGLEFDVTDVADDPADAGAWVIRLTNLGFGPAEITSVRYTLDAGEVHVEDREYEPIRDGFDRLYRDTDPQWLLAMDFSHLVAGRIWGARETLRMFAIGMPMLRPLKQFTAAYTFRSLIDGQEIDKTITWIPPYRLPDPFSRAEVTRRLRAGGAPAVSAT